MARLRQQMYPLLVLVCHLMRRLVEATAARDAANAKASQLGDAELRAAEATRRLQAQTAELRELRAFKANATKVGDLATHPAVTETQPIPILSQPASTNPAEYAPMRLSAAAEAGLL
ncbi:hypothetical protein ADK52_25355 [Streptomyces sp. WM6372]|nr:hypothetical protein ADK52_25355 [Streptomyces sp. WM6372]